MRQGCQRVYNHGIIIICKNKHASVVDSSGHGDFKQDQEAHRCYKASVVDIIDIGSSYGDFKMRPRGPKMQQGF